MPEVHRIAVAYWLPTRPTTNTASSVIVCVRTTVAVGGVENRDLQSGLLLTSSFSAQAFTGMHFNCSQPSAFLHVLLE
eukprot:6187368-Pleurochrysis_carterae.AAC.1